MFSGLQDTILSVAGEKERTRRSKAAISITNKKLKLW